MDDVEEVDADVMANTAKMLEVRPKSGFLTRRSIADGAYHVVLPTHGMKLRARQRVTRNTTQPLSAIVHRADGASGGGRSRQGLTTSTERSAWLTTFAAVVPRM